MHCPRPATLTGFTLTHAVRLAGCALLLAVLISTGTARGADAAAGKLVCVLLTKEGKVEMARRGEAQWAVAQTNQVLQVGDRLRTGVRSRATLRWSNLSVLRVNEL